MISDLLAAADASASIAIDRAAARSGETVDRYLNQLCELIEGGVSSPVITHIGTEVAVPHPVSEPLQCIGIDGSQVYPRQHTPVLLGWVTGLAYQTGPGVIAQESDCVSLRLWETAGGLSLYMGIVDIERGLIELLTATKVHQQIKDDRLILMDGGMLPWLNIGVQGLSLFEGYLQKYMEMLRAINETPIAFVIGDSQSRSLVQQLQRGARTPRPKQDKWVRDQDLMMKALTESARSPLFLINSHLSRQFQNEDIKPFFFYLRMSNEIFRIEVPSWIAMDRDLVDQLHVSILEDSRSLGYPYVLAQAHHHVAVPKDVADAAFRRAHSKYLSENGTSAQSSKSRMKGLF